MLTVLISSCVMPLAAWGDAASSAYRDAIASGDQDAVLRAQSYLTPPFAYDLNRLHGVSFTKSVNGRVVEPAFPFVYQDMANLKVRELRQRMGLNDLDTDAMSDLELVRWISDWANKQYGHMIPMPYPPWDAHEILDRIEAGNTYFCTYKAVLFVQGCNAAGLTARILGINRKDEDAHTVTEVYNNDYRTWMLVDPWLNCYYERDGVPISALDLHNVIDDPSGIDIVFGENGKGLEYWMKRTGQADTIPHADKHVPITEDDRQGLKDYYYDIRVVMRNDHTVHPQQTENRYLDGFMVPYNPRGGEWWGPQLKWSDDATPPQITADNTGDTDDFVWPLNEVAVTVRKVSLPGEPVVLEAAFKTLTPSFDRYSLDIDGASVDITDDRWVWQLHSGVNSLTVATVNKAGRRGFPSEFVLTYDPAVTMPPVPVTVAVPNQGFEETSGDNGRPAGWSTITGNNFGVKDFRLDKSVRHSGSASLMARPAVDPRTGVTYSFTASSGKFDVNPARDIVYSVWLKADKPDTPVDIFLSDDATWGLGNYVERVMIGEKWRKYELKCRLHNRLTKAVVGFKVYSGTVWADDIEYREEGGAGN